MMSNGSPASLSPLDKAAIQSYMLKFIIPSATVLAIISAGVGFGIDSVARNEAYTEAFKESAPKIQAAEVQAETAGTKAEFVVSELQDSVKRQASKISDQSSEVDQLIDRLKHKEADFTTAIEKDYDKVADALAGKEEFKKQLYKTSEQELVKMRTDIDTIVARPTITGLETSSEISINASPQTVISKIIGYDPDFCALTKVEIGNINSLCRVFQQGGAWQIVSGRDAGQLACTAICFKFKYASGK